MMIPHRAAEHMVALQGAVLRILAAVAIMGVRIATQISGRDTDGSPPRPKG
jgi:hypothetical protein